MGLTRVAVIVEVQRLCVVCVLTARQTLAQGAQCRDRPPTGSDCGGYVRDGFTFKELRAVSHRFLGQALQEKHGSI